MTDVIAYVALKSPFRILHASLVVLCMVLEYVICRHDHGGDLALVAILNYKLHRMTASNQHHGPRVSLVKLLVFLCVVLVIWSLRFGTKVTRLVQGQFGLNDEAIHALIGEGHGGKATAEIIMIPSDEHKNPPFSSYSLPTKIPEITTRKTCGMKWEKFVKEFAFDRFHGPIIWTVSGGPEYRYHMGKLLDRWQSLDHETPLLVLGLDTETTKSACESGYSAVHWDLPAQSYSRVADAKFMAAAQFADKGIDALFIELDIFCRKPPLALMLEQADKADIVQIAHGDLMQRTNIGMYYVKARPETRDFFLSLSSVLLNSVNQTKLRGKKGNLKAWFDQDIFQRCREYAPRSRLKESYHLVEDKKLENNLLKACKNNITSSHVSNELISSYAPPLVMDTTVCIHPLARAPFSSFAHKLATAKILGFDPEPMREDEQFLKVWNGDLSNNENWGRTYQRSALNEGRLQQRAMIKHQVAALIHIARETNRTLIFPRHVREGDGHTYPVYALVDMKSVDSLVRWRYMTVEESHRQEHRTSVVEMGTDLTSVLNDTRYCDSYMCAVHSLYKMEPQQVKAILAGIISNLTWCFDYKPYSLDHYPMTQAIGSYAPLCGPSKADKIK
jgi:hypothetical protein